MADTADTDRAMEQSLLLRRDEQEGEVWGRLSEEVKKQGYLSAPMAAVVISQYLLQVISLTMVGHLGNLALSSSAIAISLATVSGFSLLSGMSTALETLCGQAYGAMQYQKVGILTQTAIFSLILVCIPISLIWIFMGKVLFLIGQDPAISDAAGKFIIWLLPALFAHAVLQPLIRYFQMQSLIKPMLISSFITLCFHVPVCWVLVFKSGLENVGAALAMCISFWVNVIVLGLFMKYSSACDETRAPISMELFHGIREFFLFAIPSAAMTCLEWWTYELVVLLAGLLPNPQLETSVLSVCLATLTTLYAIPFGFGAAVSTRVSNELGAGNPQAARIAVYAVTFLVVAMTTIVSGTLFASRHKFGYIFSNEKDVVDYVTTISPLVCLSFAMSSLEAVLSGIARGCGWQHIGAYINLGAFYVFGIPVGVLLGFGLNLRGVGLWVGVQVGAFVQILLLSIVTGCVNWELQARKAREMVGEGKCSIENGTM